MSTVQPRAFRTITGHKELRDALRDTTQYSSDLQGDPDVRDYRQIPLEIDPPAHHSYRAALAPYFVKSTIENFEVTFFENSKRLIDDFFNNGPKDCVGEFSLPLVLHNLGAIYSRPQDVDEWLSWGPDVWTAESSERSGKTLHKYLRQVYEEAMDSPHHDVWREIVNLQVENRKITYQEFLGIAGVMLAGGRDTLVKLFTGMMWHFGRSADLDRIEKGHVLPANAIQEFLRFLSPLPAMNRTTVPESGAKTLPEDRYVSMSFVSGNFDERVFHNPFAIDLTRERNPHLSFGFGPHTCLGNHISEIEARALLSALVQSPYRWRVIKESITYHESPLDRVPLHFNSLHLGLM